MYSYAYNSQATAHPHSPSCKHIRQSLTPSPEGRLPIGSDSTSRMWQQGLAGRPQTDAFGKSKAAAWPENHFISRALIYHCLLFCLLISDSLNFRSITSLPVKAMRYAGLSGLSSREDKGSCLFITTEKV
jgi:hypothetical protein